MKELEKSNHSGKFTIAPGREIHGELKFAGPETSLYVWDKEYFDIIDTEDHSVMGVLHDLTKVTLIDCISSPAPGIRSVGLERNYFANVFPHFVAVGNEIISPKENCITDIQFVMSDATSLFYDFDAFGHVINATPLIEEVVKANNLDRDIEIGPHPQIAYFTGKTEILSVDTVLGRISATHAPSWNLGGPRGVKIDNTIFVSLCVEDAINFHEGIDRTATLLRFLGLLVGRQQNLLDLTFRIKSDEGVMSSR